MSISFSLKDNADLQQQMLAMQADVARCHQALHEKTGKGNDFLGWLDLPENYDRAELACIKQAAKRIQTDSAVLIVIGIGGSYLGARTALDFIQTPYYNQKEKNTPEIFSGVFLMD